LPPLPSKLAIMTEPVKSLSQTLLLPPVTTPYKREIPLLISLSKKLLERLPMQHQTTWKILFL